MKFFNFTLQFLLLAFISGSALAASPAWFDWTDNGTTTAMSLSDSGDIQCVSTDGVNCQWGTTTAATQNLTIKPAVCGSQVAKTYWGTNGYDTAGHWCNRVFARFYAKWQPAPGDLGVMYAINPQGDVMCNSYDHGNCSWGDLNPVSTQTVDPLTCGSMNKQLWGTDGYSDPSHWCSKIMAMIPTTERRVHPTLSAPTLPPLYSMTYVPNTNPTSYTQSVPYAPPASVTNGYDALTFPLLIAPFSEPNGQSSGYYLAHQFGLLPSTPTISEHTMYIGIVLGVTKNAATGKNTYTPSPHFSYFGSTDQPGDTPTPANCSHGADGGPGITCTYHNGYQLTPGDQYQLSVTRLATNADANTTTWRGTITDLSQDPDIHIEIGQITTPAGLLIVDSGSFFEHLFGNIDCSVWDDLTFLFLNPIYYLNGVAYTSVYPTSGIPSGQCGSSYSSDLRSYAWIKQGP